MSDLNSALYGTDPLVVKLAAAMVSVDVSSPDFNNTLLQGLIRQHPFMSPYSIVIDISSKNDASQAAIGVFQIKPPQPVMHGAMPVSPYGPSMMGHAEAPVDYSNDPSIRVPIIVLDGQAYPFDVFYDSSHQPQPLTQVRINASLTVASAEISAPMSLAQNDPSGMESSAPYMADTMGHPGLWSKAASADVEFLQHLAANGAYTNKAAQLLREAEERYSTDKVANLATNQGWGLLTWDASRNAFFVDAGEGKQELQAEKVAQIRPEVLRNALVDDCCIIRWDSSPGLKLVRHAKVASVEQGHGVYGVSSREARSPEPSDSVVLFSDVLAAPAFMSKMASCALVSCAGGTADVASLEDLDLWDPSAEKTASVNSALSPVSLWGAPSGPGRLVFQVNGRLAVSEQMYKQASTPHGALLAYGVPHRSVLAKPGTGVLSELHASYMKTASPSNEDVVYLGASVMWLPCESRTSQQLLKSASLQALDTPVVDIVGNQHLNKFEFSCQQLGLYAEVGKLASMRLLASLGDTHEGAVDKLAAATQLGQVSFYADEALARPEPVVSGIISKTAAESFQDAGLSLPSAEAIADMAWADQVYDGYRNAGDLGEQYLNKGVVKQAAVTARTLDSVLSLNFLNDNTLNKYLSMIPDLEIAVRKMADLAIAGRMGLRVDHVRAASAMQAANQVLEDLKRLQVLRALGGGR